MTAIHGETEATVPEGAITCGEATMRLLARYGVDVVFGIPGVHTLDFCRGLSTSSIHHVQARNEQGAGFMADGYARATGRPGVALVISGPGVTNALTAIGQAYADSIPVLMLSSETDSRTHGKGWGALHEITDQRAVTEPMTALSLRAGSAADVPDLIAQAWAVFESERPRPVHVSVPIDVLAEPVSEEWEPRPTPRRPVQNDDDIAAAVEILQNADRPIVMVGGGAVDAVEPIRALVDGLDAPVVSSTAGKGIVPDDHPLSLSASTVRPEVQEWIASADAVLAVGTELAETDSFVDALDFRGPIIRIDIDRAKLNDQYTAAVGIAADAAPAVAAIVETGAFVSDPDRRAARTAEVAAVRANFMSNLTDSEARHTVLLEAMDDAFDDDTIFMGDICQIVYTGAFAMPRRKPRTWSYPAGYCTLGCGLPDAIGAKMARPDADIVVLAGDGGFMFTVQELIVATEEGLGLPIVIWENGGLKQIQDDMKARSIDLVGVTGRNPDFMKLAESMGADGVIATSLDHAISEIRDGLAKDRPTVIVVDESSEWLSRPIGAEDIE